MFESFRSAVLFIDISGFTSLSARLGTKGSVGIEQLSEVLNLYFSQQIEIVTERELKVILKVRIVRDVRLTDTLSSQMVEMF